MQDGGHVRQQGDRPDQGGPAGCGVHDRTMVSMVRMLTHIRSSNQSRACDDFALTIKCGVRSIAVAQT